MKFSEIKIEWVSIIRDLLKNAWAIFLAALIGLMGVYVATRSIYTPEYTSSATIVVSAKSATSGSYSLFSVSVEMADIISRVIVEPTVKEKACEIMNIDKFDGDLSAKMHTSTNFVKLSVKSDSPQKSYDLLKGVLEAYPQVSDSVFDNVVISVLSMPEVPHSPSNSISKTNKMLVAGGAALIVAGLVVILSILRDTVKDEDDFEKKVDAKLLGSIPHERKHISFKERIKKQKKALLIHNDAFISFKFIENYHKVAAKFEYIKRHEGAKVFAVTSVAENEGKSTVASNIAISLADRGHKVVLIDIDSKKPAIYKIFNKKYSENTELANLMNGKIKSSDFRMKRYKKTSLFLAVNTSPHNEYSEWIESGKITQVIEGFKEQVDFIIFDTAPMSVDSYVTDLAKLVERMILVVRTDIVHTSAINDAVTTLEEVGSTVAGCILNDVYPETSYLTLSGSDESRYSYGWRYGRYKKYGAYSRYGSRYGRYTKPHIDSDEDDLDE